MKVFNAKTIYTLNVIGHLLESDNRKAPSKDIADKYKISVPFLSQILSELREGGIVSSKKGPGGGYALVEKAETKTLADVLGMIDESTKDPLHENLRKGTFCENAIVAINQQNSDILSRPISSFL